MKSTDRPVHWIKAAKKDFCEFPDPVQSEALSTLTIVAEGHFTDNLKPLNPDGHFKFPRLWPVKFLRAGRVDYGLSVVPSAMREAASLRR